MNENILENLIKRLSKLPGDCAPKTSDEGYKIQNKLTKTYLSQKNTVRIIGKKIGCTNKAAQKQINVHEPFYGNIFSNYSSKSECAINSSNFFQPYVEPEFSFKINFSPDPIKAPFDNDDIEKCILSVLPSIEIVDSRFKDWKSIGINNLIADNGVNAYWIHGKEIKNFKGIDFKNHKVSLKINNKIVVRGNSKNVMGNPINSIVWLANTLADKNQKIPKNAYISTGTCTPAIQIYQGDKITANFGKLGKVSFVYK